MTGPAFAVLLFGSLARGERSMGSDIDVLFIRDGGEVKHVTGGRISIFHYPWKLLRERSSSGDLFACHIAFEAKPILDARDYLAKLRSAFRFKCAYQEEAGHAADLAWFLVRHGGSSNMALVPKRMIWCVRTILIARSAEARRPVFSPNVLMGLTRSNAAREILSGRHDRAADALMRDRLQRFLCDDVPHDPFHREATLTDFIARFEETGNGTALQTVARMAASSSLYL